ncbi:branched-subunit amino acid aminotransferase/4-amino-4-deoxychorismate lyase [Diaminobutyricimonas aerilata]|uniref:Branched-subunit amino acid aminotransferase/4-amino-4-deoxychorismate lyase n=1 Tax=Diaminobutyricimonas aerilata TaxID=1162967 RepID=A0A2M9CJB8_9MICO|nr:aminotransferase class IV [Diaminobutyricimonas aerilata]PJJ71999.1 branched-subunit amino acid aminotransferase/4-amino-4-deoxychorismate lyase [Diaminobutyricimonas aerilata]
MSAPLRWIDGALVPDDTCDTEEAETLVADSWIVRDGRTLAIDLHRRRFLDGTPATERAEAARVWDAVVASVPERGDWFPRIEARRRRGTIGFAAWLRPAPERSNSVVLATHDGADPRRRPRVKGPDLAALGRARAAVQARGAGEAVLLSPERFVVEGAYSSIVWWRGSALCVVHAGLDRVDSVTERVLRTIATALRIEVREELVTPDELDGLEVWALSALHGARLATAWLDGPQLAAEPGRLNAWNARLEALRK